MLNTSGRRPILPIAVEDDGSGGYLEIFATAPNPRARFSLRLQNRRASNAFGVRLPFVFPVESIQSKTHTRPFHGSAE